MTHLLWTIYVKEEGEKQEGREGEREEGREGGTCEKETGQF
jgi:hypothetical protein